MGETNQYSGRPQRIRSGGGSVAVIISATYVGQGNGGTSLPVAGCWVSAALANSGHINMNIGAAATDTLGIELAESDAAAPLWVPISDLAELYFYGASAADVVNITYLLG